MHMHSTHCSTCPPSITLPGDWRNLNGIRRTEEGSMQISGFPAMKQATMSSCRRLSWNSGAFTVCSRLGDMCCCGSMEEGWYRLRISCRKSLMPWWLQRGHLWYKRTSTGTKANYYDSLSKFSNNAVWLANFRGIHLWWLIWEEAS